jgi:hypothetical protein
MKLRLPILATALALMAMMAITPTALAASNTTSAVTAPVTGTIASGGTFTGTLTNIVISNTNGVLTATGNLSGTLTKTDAAGNVIVIGTISNLLITLTAAATGTCQILHLTLGPLDLNLLGLMVHLDQVVLDITAQSGPGNLLGNLLCAVAHLLDNSGPLSGLAALLNNILRNL